MDDHQLAEQLLNYAKQGNWRMLVATVLTATVWFLRTVAIRPGLEALPKVGPLLRWFKTDRGGVVLSLSVGVLGGLGTALSAHHAITGDILLTGVVNGVLGSGIFVTLKKLAKPGDKPVPAIAQPDLPPAAPPAGGAP